MDEDTTDIPSALQFNSEKRPLASKEYFFPAGWYPDPWVSPDFPLRKRFWTGRNWSSKTRQN